MSVTQQSRRLGAGSCKSKNYLKGITYSLFGTVEALNRMQKNQAHQFEWSLMGGTLIAQQRNVKIFAWDDDADIFLMFKENGYFIAYNETRLDAFYEELKIKVAQITNSNPSFYWSEAHTATQHTKRTFNKAYGARSSIGRIKRVFRCFHIATKRKCK